MSARTNSEARNRDHDEPDCLRAASTDHRHDAGARPGAGRALQRLPDAEGHLSVAQPAAALRHPQLRRDGPQADRGPDHQRLRAVLPVHQRRGARRVAVDPEHGDAQAVLPAGHRHGRGDGPDGRLLQPSPVGHAQWVAAAVCGPARRGQPAGRLSGLREPEPLGRRAPGHGALPGPADVLGPGGHLVAAPFRRQHPDYRRQRRPRPSALVQPLAPGRRRRDRPRQLHQPFRQRDDQGPDDRRAGQYDGHRVRKSCATSRSSWGKMSTFATSARSPTRPIFPSAMHWSTAASRSTCRWSSRPPPRR